MPLYTERPICKKQTSTIKSGYTMRNGDTSVLYRAISMLSANDTIIMPFKTSVSAHGQAYSAKNRLVHPRYSV